MTFPTLCNAGNHHITLQQVDDLWDGMYLHRVYVCENCQEEFETWTYSEDGSSVYPVQVDQFNSSVTNGVQLRVWEI